MELENLMKEIEDIKEKLNMPPVVGKFHKISLEQFIKDFKKEDNIPDEKIKEIYENVLIKPVRSSVDSAGHDFVLTKDINLNVNESAVISTGIRAEIAKGWVLLLMPRSGLGVKFRVQLNNTVGVIDGDYFHTDNEGHILVTITNDGKENKPLHLKAGDRFIQGIFVPYGITEDDKPLGKRKGGRGSSGLKSK